MKHFIPLQTLLIFQFQNRFKCTLHIDTYSVAFKESVCGDLKYGADYYNYQEGTLVFMAPGQVVEINNDPENFHPKGRALFFHPDLLHGTTLGVQLKSILSFHTVQMKHCMYLRGKSRS